MKNIIVNYLRSNELYDIFEVLYYENGNIVNTLYPQFPRSSHHNVESVYSMYV